MLTRTCKFVNILKRIVIYMNKTEPAFQLAEVEPLDTGSFVPFYVQLAESMSNLIEQAGDRAIGKAIPSEAECVQHFRVSRPTVRQAMSDLARSGLVVKQPGRGTFVAPRLRHEMAHGFEEEMNAAKRKVQLRLLDWQRVCAPEEVRLALQLEDHENVWRLRRLRKVDGVPVGLEERYFTDVLGKRISSHYAKSEPMLVLLKKATGEHSAQLRAEVTSGIADAELASVLDAKEGVPVLVKSLTYLFHGKPLAYGYTTFLSQYYQFRFSVNLPI